VILWTINKNERGEKRSKAPTRFCIFYYILIFCHQRHAKKLKTCNSVMFELKALEKNSRCKKVILLSCFLKAVDEFPCEKCPSHTRRKNLFLSSKTGRQHQENSIQTC
jgi:hypothetical protein